MFRLLKLTLIGGTIMEHKLPELPWSNDALAPHISAETIEYHYGKHHNAYVTKLNAGIEGTEYAEMSLEDIIMKASGGLFNNAAQVWNHTFYWNCLAPNAGGAPSGAISDKINAKWGSFDKFKEEFTNSAATNFGSGWTWLVEKNGDVEIMNTDDADTPMKHGAKALMTIDVWEHAYYVDYRNARPNYITAFWNLVNWDFVNSNL
jgi:Fe-Mn family superoxide dismutase